MVVDVVDGRRVVGESNALLVVFDAMSASVAWSSDLTDWTLHLTLRHQHDEV
jgi:hypothetical protein